MDELERRLNEIRGRKSFGFWKNIDEINFEQNTYVREKLRMLNDRKRTRT